MTHFPSFVSTCPLPTLLQNRSTTLFPATRNSTQRPHTPVALARNNRDNRASQQSQQSQQSQHHRRFRRKTSTNIERSREQRARAAHRRRPLIASWSGAVLAESTQYDFIDGRFFFPSDSVRWHYLEDTGHRKHINPIGPVRVFDIVLRSHSPRRNNHIIARNRASVFAFEEARRTWNAMKGYTCFHKGVDILFKPPNFRQSILPGEVRGPGGDLAHLKAEATLWEDFAVALDETMGEGDCLVERNSP